MVGGAEGVVMGSGYDDVIAALRVAYDGGAATRDGAPKTGWKLAERAAFLDRVSAGRLLEIGAGTGEDSLFFTQGGLDVLAIDLSAEMVARSRAKGLDARVMSFSDLDLDAGSFDAVYAMNCLLHVPNADLPAVLSGIRTVLKPGGLLFIGVYGGTGHEGPIEGDKHVPPRFFSFRTDDQIQELVREFFEIVDFHLVDSGPDLHFQSLTLRRPS